MNGDVTKGPSGTFRIFYAEGVAYMWTVDQARKMIRQMMRGEDAQRPEIQTMMARLRRGIDIARGVK